MRVALALIALTGCTQIFGLTEPVRQAISDATAADVEIDGAGPRMDTAMVLTSCEPSDTAVLACYDFQGNTLDGSTGGNDATAVNVTYVPGRRGQAIHVGLTSMVTPPLTAVWNITAFTVMAWVRLDTLPTTGMARAGVFDADARYGLFVHADGSFSCRSTNTAAGLLQVGEWHHLAVTDDGVTRRFYLNGAEVAAVASTNVTMSSTEIEIGGNAPTGDRLVGSLDSLRVYRAARPAHQIVIDATP